MDPHEAFMQQAIALATRAIGLSDPNPRVGCVIVAADGQQVLGEGHTQAAGQAHAEVMALRDARARGHSVAGATVYVSLEPCSHHGRTAPCCDALLAAGIGKVVAALPDPNPLVAGQGLERLRAAGVEVVVGPGAEASREMNIGFFSRMLRQLPWVRMKIAASLDGKTALDSGASQWITSPAARSDGHAWRARASAVLTGIGTVREDNPRLDVRAVPTTRQPDVVVVDSRLETPLDASVFLPGRRLFIYAATADPARVDPLQRRGATVISLPGPGGKVDLSAMLRDLARRDVNELHVEAGHKLNGSLIHEGLVDEILIYLAPKLVGRGREMAHFGPLADLAEAVAFEFLSSERVGPDLRVLARVPGRAGPLQPG
jgi:diaminohydroxyphosphoribosylaminopyrimidine deaminase / 5-amino-6-(5-phosphoribosylamino)uracil reductase